MKKVVIGNDKYENDINNIDRKLKKIVKVTLTKVFAVISITIFCNKNNNLFNKITLNSASRR